MSVCCLVSYCWLTCRILGLWKHEGFPLEFICDIVKVLRIVLYKSRLLIAWGQGREECWISALWICSCLISEPDTGEGRITLSVSSVQFSRSVMSDSLWPHESQHTRPPCPSPTPGVHSDSRPSSQWCHPAISSSDVPFSSCPQSLPASESFPISQLFAWGGQSTGVSALASVLPKNIVNVFKCPWLFHFKWLPLC